jgi:hypothetical protein
MGSRPRTHGLARRARLALAAAAAAVVLGGIVPGFAPRASAAAPESRPIAVDVSWPNCGRALPPTAVLAVVGVTGGRPFTKNPCLRDQYTAARGQGAVRFYLTLNKARGPVSLRGPAGRCAARDWACRGFNYGWQAARRAWRYAASQVGPAALHTRWWLDVETTNSWSRNRTVNARVVAGALAFLRSRGHADRVGVYSTRYQWARIAGAYRPGVDVWYATAVSSATEAAKFCAAKYGFTGGRVRMVQYAPVRIDRDYLCR